MDSAISKNNVPIRFTIERWYHISLGHPEIADFYYDILETIENPNYIYEGKNKELLAVKSNHLSRKNLIVVYREINPSDGFIITAYLSKKVIKFVNKRLIWKQ